MKNKKRFKSLDMKKLCQLILRCLIITFFILIFSVVISSVARFLLVSNIPFLGVEEGQANLVAVLIQGIVAGVAASLVFHELRMSVNEEARRRDIEEAQFILQYNQSFIQDENMCQVEALLEKWLRRHKEKEDICIINESNRQLFINYMVYLEGLAALVLRGVLQIEHIDDLMAYRFFLAVNNPEVQRSQLRPYASYYRGCFKLYTIWKQYRIDKNYPILLGEYSLDKWILFNEYGEIPDIT